MYPNIWFFLTVATLLLCVFLVVLIISINKQKLKELELEAARTDILSVQKIVDEALVQNNAELLARIEVLEAIVTDTKHQLDKDIKGL